MKERSSLNTNKLDYLPSVWETHIGNTLKENI
jgi:hypothetical protein